MGVKISTGKNVAGGTPAPQPEPHPTVSSPPAETPPAAPTEAEAPVAVEMELVFTDAQGEEERLQRLLAKAMELEHPGIDPEGVETMKGFIAAGRFPHSHYINMWTKRLEDMGVKIVQVSEPDISLG